MAEALGSVTGTGYTDESSRNMTFQQVAATLPNGFHDAELEHLQMDYVHRKLQFDLLVWVGDLEDTERREVYRPARLTVDDVGFLVIEPPDPNSPWFKAGSIRIDAGEGHPGHGHSSTVLPAAPAGTTITWMYLEELNRFCFFSAGDASLLWTGPEVNRT